MKKKIILIIGPESSGTRIMANYIGQHPDVLAPNNITHIDVFNDVWNLLEDNKIEEAKEKTNILLKERDVLIARRSLPHGKDVGKSAKFLNFNNADVGKLYNLLDSIGIDLCVIITSRSPSANLMSWKSSRESCSKQMDRAKTQYKKAYKLLFSVLSKYEIEFFVTSLEGILYDGPDYIKGIYNLIGLNPFTPIFVNKDDTNKKRYTEFFKDQH